MKADPETTAAVLAMLDELNEAYKQRNLERLLALFAPDSDMVFYGTGADEKRLGLAELKTQAERDWSQSESLFLSGAGRQSPPLVRWPGWRWML